MSDLESCDGCGVAPGQVHGEDCDWARCPDCGEQLCGHGQGDCENPGPERPAIWHGLDPREEVAQKLGWWTTVVGIDHLVEDTTRVLYAGGLGQITWNPQAQRYDIGQVDEAALNDSTARAR